MKEYAVLALGDSMAGREGREKGTVCWLDSNGKEKASFESGESVTYLLAAEKGVVIGNDRRYTGLTHSGNESWNYTATADMTDLIPMQKLDRVMMVGKEEVAIYDMNKMQNAAGGVEKVEPDEEETDVSADDNEKDGVKADSDRKEGNEPADGASDETNDADMKENTPEDEQQGNE